MSAKQGGSDGGVKVHSSSIAQVTAEEKEEEIDEEVGVPYPNLQETMYYFEQGGVSVCVCSTGHTCNVICIVFCPVCMCVCVHISVWGDLGCACVLVTVFAYR